MAAAAPNNVTPLRKLDDKAGGATVDSSVLGSVRFAAGTRDLEAAFRKGDDVLIVVVGRVTGVPVRDKYDAHGNVVETIRSHEVRIDEVQDVKLLQQGAAKTAAQAQEEERSGGTEQMDVDGAADAQPERSGGPTPQDTRSEAERLAGGGPADDEQTKRETTDERG